MVNFFMKMVAKAGNNNTACYKVTTGPDYGSNLSVEVAEEIKNLLWYRLECQMEYRTHTNSWDSLL